MRHLLFVIASCAFGCLNAAYCLVRLRDGRDVRALGRGNAGARNVLLARYVAPTTPWASGVAFLGDMPHASTVAIAAACAIVLAAHHPRFARAPLTSPDRGIG